jgi:tetratricopeptide repeat protein 21B
MIANLLLMKDQTEAAIQTYIQLLEKSPDNFNTLSQLIELLRRAGRMDELAKYLTAAEKACRRSNMAGLAFCKGLNHYYQHQPSDALKELNVARYDSVFGTLANCTMIEIYLNPGNEM